MNKITLEGDTPASTVAMMLALARPHFVQRPPANENAPVTVQPDHRDVVRTTELTGEQPSAATEQPQPEKVETVAVETTRTGRKPRQSKANERIAEILSAEAKEGSEDPLPASDQVGAETRKPAEEPDELKLPEFLDRKAAKAAEPVKVPSLDYMRKLLVKFGEKSPIDEVIGLLGKTINGPDFVMKPGTNPPKLSQIPEDKRAGVVAEFRKKVTVDEVPEE